MADEVIVLTHGRVKGTSCRIQLFGATIISWTVDGVENIFLSSKAVLDGSRAIRGGIPICFPSFGPWEHGPNHGFARISSNWSVTQNPVSDDDSGDVHVRGRCVPGLLANSLTLHFAGSTRVAGRCPVQGDVVQPALPL